MDQEEAKRRSARVTSVSNVAYDLLVVLINKLEGVAAMEEYESTLGEVRRTWRNSTKR